MSDELIISGGGGVAVATGEMVENAHQLVRAAEFAREIAAAIQHVDARLTEAQLDAFGAPIAAGFAEDDLRCAYAHLVAFGNRSEDLSFLVRTAATSYGLAEKFAEEVSYRVAADAAAVLGFLFPFWAGFMTLASPALPIVAALAIGAYTLNRNGVEVLPPELVSSALNEYITDPTFVWALRHAVMSFDEFVAGKFGVPPALVTVLSIAGIGGLPPMAGLIQRAGGTAGILRETPVSLVSRSEPAPVEAPQGYEDLMARIPQPSESEPAQIRIEEYEQANGEPRWAVYVSGTVDFGVANTGEPFDSTSNVSNAAGGDSAALAAVVAAMADAGITSESEVWIFGHSQAAGTGARLAESGEFNTQGLLLVGGNTGQIPIPPSIPTVIVEHRDDIVPATGGRQDNAHALVIEREAYKDRPLPAGVAVPAHRLDAYLETARLMDADSRPGVERSIDKLLQFGSGSGAATVTHYHYERDGS